MTSFAERFFDSPNEHKKDKALYVPDILVTRHERALDPFSAPMNAIIDCSFSCREGINSYRSAISASHLQVDSLAVGKYPIVSRFMRSCVHSESVGETPLGCSVECEGNSWGLSGSSLAHLRNAETASGLSQEVQAIIAASWQPETTRSYNSAWKLWDSWCHERALDPFSAPLNAIIEFLTAQFHAGKEYSTINSYRSAISASHLQVDSLAVGVSRLMHGITVYV